MKPVVTATVREIRTPTMNDSQAGIHGASITRRSFIRYLAASPLFTTTAVLSTPGNLMAFGGLSVLEENAMERLITTPEEAINVFDFEQLASQIIPPAHFGFLTTGVDDDRTRDTNHQAYADYYLRPRKLVDVTRTDTATTLFGERFAAPVFLCPIGAHKAFHQEGERAVAHAAGTVDFPMCLSTMTSTAVEDVAEARDRPVWYQLYPTSEWSITKKLLRRAENAGCQVMALTVDLPVTSNRETQARLLRLDSRDCKSCHTDPYKDMSRKPMFQGLGLPDNLQVNPSNLTWDYIRRLKGESGMKLLIKGIVTKEDAELCLEYGVDGIIVSNHGGRADESGRATIDSLAEIAPVVGTKIPVMVDGGVRRGTDIFKALAMGAAAVGIGRPYVWGLGTFGEAGVKKVLEILLKELETTMKLAGVNRIDEIQRSYIGKS